MVLNSIIVRSSATTAHPQEIKRQAMIGCSTPLSNGGTMFLGGIPLVTIPVIIRIFLVKAVHVVITIGLCQNGGGSDGKVLPVSFHYGSMRQVPIFLKRLPSISRCCGRTFSWSTARCMARKEALRILILSISSGETTPTAHARASFSITSRKV